MRCPLLVSERMLRRPKLTAVLSCLTAVLADRARWADTLWTGSEDCGRGRRLERFTYRVLVCSGLEVLPVMLLPE